MQSLHPPQTDRVRIVPMDDRHGVLPCPGRDGFLERQASTSYRDLSDSGIARPRSWSSEISSNGLDPHAGPSTSSSLSSASVGASKTRSARSASSTSKLPWFLLAAFHLFH